MTNQDTIEIRLLDIEDEAALERLADVETASIPPAPVLGGIVEGRLVAAHSLATGESIADPFRHTAQIRSLLSQRARQMRGSGGRGPLNRLRRMLGGEIGARPKAASEAVR